MNQGMSIGNTMDTTSSYIVSRSSVVVETRWRFINLSYLNGVSPGNNFFAKEMLKIFKAESISFLENIALHRRREDFHALAKSAHAMKPTGSYIGVEKFTTLVTSLEKVARLQDRSTLEPLVAKIIALVNDVNEEIDEYLYAA